MQGLLFGLLIAVIVFAIGWTRLTKHAVVASGTKALLYRNGVFQRELAPGYHRWFDAGDRTKLRTVPDRTVSLDAHEYSVLTKDQFSFRLTITPLAKIIDPQAHFDATPDDHLHFGLQHLHFPLLHPTLASLVLDHVSQMTLDEFMADPRTGLLTMRDALTPALPGAVVEDILVTGVTMPPEVRKMFTEVERARRDGLAALERARAETAALRALANAARSLQSNPELAHLRMVQAMETAKGSKTFVLGTASASDIGVGSGK